MKAVVYADEEKMVVRDVPPPKTQQSTDIIVKITSAAICGSDLHMYDGRTPMDKGKVFGHEIMGIVAETGPGVQQLKEGDRVVLPFNIACGDCYNCLRGYTNACLTTNPDSPGAAYGYAGMGPYQGGQTEYVRVPYADFNALKLPGKPHDELENDFLMLADIMPTAWHANELAQVGMGQSLAIYGAGPVGLLSILSARLRGASEIYAIDNIGSRLAKAEELGAIPIDFSSGDPAEQIIARRRNDRGLLAAEREGEEKRLEGVDRAIDAIGYQARDFQQPDKENATQVLENMAAVVAPTGAVGLIGVYLPEDPGASKGDWKEGRFTIPLGQYWDKGIAIGMGQCPVKRYDEQLRDTIIAGKLHPGTIVTHEITIDEAPEYYQRFDAREEGVHKVVIKFR